MNFKENYHYLIIFSLFLIISFFIGSYLDFNRHWTTNYDHEFTLAYNALLFNNGKSIEYVAHPGYFTILFLSLFIKLLSILSFISVDKLSLLTSENFDQSFQILMFYTRVYSSFCVALFCFITYVLFFQFSKNKFYSLILSLIIFSSLSTIFHSAQLRTELLAMFFLSLSLICLKLFLENIQKYKVLFLASFFLFLFCALLNKMQIFFFIPCIFLIFYFYDIMVEDFNINEFTFLEKRWIPYAITLIYLFYIYIQNNTQHPFPYVSSLAVIFNILFMNIFFYLIFKKNKKKIKFNLIVINLIFILVFFILKNFLSIHPSTSPILFTNLTRVMDLSMYMSHKPEINNLLSFLLVVIERFGNYFNHVLSNIILKFNTQFLLISSIIILTIIFKNKLTKNIIKFNITCCAVAILIMLVNSYRASGNVLLQYYIFSDLFLVLPLCTFSKHLKYRYLMAILILIFFSNLNLNLKYLKSKKISDQSLNAHITNLCKSTYFYDWQKLLKKEYIENYCSNFTN